MAGWYSIFSFNCKSSLKSNLSVNLGNLYDFNMLYAEFGEPGKDLGRVLEGDSEKVTFLTLSLFMLLPYSNASTFITL